MTKRSILVTGVSGDSYGAGIAPILNEDYDVYTMQRNPPNGLPYSRWYDHDLNEPDSTPRCLQEMDRDVGPIANKPSFWAVVHCSSVQTKLHLSSVTSMEIRDQFNANVAEPLKIISYMLQFGLLEWTGKVIFIEDPRNFGPELAIYGACKDSMSIFVDAMQQDWPATLDVQFLGVQAKSRSGWEKQGAEAILDILKGV